jgi:hypothetical protein
VKLIRLALARNLARSLNHEGCLVDWTQTHLCKSWRARKKLLSLYYIFGNAYSAVLSQTFMLYVPSSNEEKTKQVVGRTGQPWSFCCSFLNTLLKLQHSNGNGKSCTKIIPVFSCCRYTWMGLDICPVFTLLEDRSINFFKIFISYCLFSEYYYRTSIKHLVHNNLKLTIFSCIHLQKNVIKKMWGQLIPENIYLSLHHILHGIQV